MDDFMRKLTRRDGEYILWHILRHLQMEYIVNWHSGLMAAIQTIRKLLLESIEQ